MVNTSPSSDCSAKQVLQSVDKVVSLLSDVPVRKGKIRSYALKDALNKALAEDIYSEINVPPSANSAVDGYALRLEDWQAGLSLPVSDRITAGAAPGPLKPGTVARIFTGATIPEGADAVVMQEYTLTTEDSQINIEQAPQRQDNIRPEGQDVAEGDLILNKGQILSPHRLGLLASIGQANVKAYAPLTVAMMSTGDELLEPGQAAAPGQIYNSNRYLLDGLLQSLGFTVLDLGVVPDNADATRSALQSAAQQADVILTTGGASVGEEDHIRAAISDLGQVDLWRVAIKPGKPFMFGNIQGVPVCGLPGNPGAVLITFLMLVKPFLLKQQGFQSCREQGMQLQLGFGLHKPGPRREYLRVMVGDDGRLIRHPNQSSGMLSSASWAQGLAIIPEHQLCKENDVVTYLPFSSLLHLPAD